MKKFFALLLILLFGQSGFAQSAQPEAKLVDEFGEICSEDIAMRFDSLMVEFQTYPSSKIYFIFNGGSLEGQNLTFLKYYQLYLNRVKGVDESKIVILRGKNIADMRTQIWIVPEGAVPPTVNADFVESAIASPTMFDKSWADDNDDIYTNDFVGNKLRRRKISRAEADKAFYYSYDSLFGEWGCSTVNSKDFAKFLFANPNVTGYFVIYTEFGKGAKQADKVARLVLQDMAHKKVPLNRVKTVYGGSRKEPQVELWLVPEGQKFQMIKAKK